MVIASSIPTIDKEMEEETVRALREEMLVGGKSIAKFEEEFARYVGIKHAVAVASGTDALVIALRCLGITKKVITTPMSFVATAESIVLAGAQPKFADIDNSTWNINPDEIEKQIDSDTEAIMPVHLYGMPCHMDRIKEIAEKNDLHIIEDCAQAHGTKWGSKHVGTFGEVGCFSFYSTKNMTVGGNGGMLVTDDEEIAEKAKLLREHGGANEAKYIGYNARMNTINAAIGRIQLKRLDGWIDTRRKLADKYYVKCKDWGVGTSPPAKEHVYHLFVIETDRRDELRRYLRSNKIFCGIHYPISINQLEPYKKYADGVYPNSEHHARLCLSLPLYPSLSNEEFEFVSNTIDSFYGVNK